MGPRRRPEVFSVPPCGVFGAFGLSDMGLDLACILAFAYLPLS